MQSRIKKIPFYVLAAAAASLMLFAQQSDKPTMSITGIPSEPIVTGDCTSSTFGYMELSGKQSGFTDAQFGHAIRAALRQGYVITIYPPTKSGIFLNQECHGGRK